MAAVQPRLTVIGANHKSASLTLRDALFVDDSQAPGILAALKEAGLPEALVLSTCDRVEVWATTRDAEAAAAMVARVLGMRAGLDPQAVEASLFTLTGADAVAHGFTVTAALDSLVIGEPHVAGQVKAAYHLAREAGTLGGELDGFVQAAFAVAKRVRSETAIGEGPVSIAAAAVQVARDLHGAPEKLSALMVGTGEMGELVAESLLAAGLGRLMITAPRPARAEALAKGLGCHVLAFEDLREALADADIVLTCLGGRATVIGAEAVAQALRKRRRRPILLVDVAIPGDVEVAVNRQDGAFLYDLGDLEKVALEGRAGREAAARAARTIVETETQAFLKGRAARAAVPAIVSLRSHFEVVRDAVLEEAGDDAAEATRLLVNRLLHAPTEAMKDKASGSPDWAVMEKTLKTLFKLED